MFFMVVWFAREGGEVTKNNFGHELTPEVGDHFVDSRGKKVVEY